MARASRGRQRPGRGAVRGGATGGVTVY